MQENQSTPSEQIQQLASYLDDLRRSHMPFGRYGPAHFPPSGKPIHMLPLEYLAWFKNREDGFPKGRLGELMRFVFEVKSAGAEEVFSQLRD